MHSNKNEHRLFGPTASILLAVLALAGAAVFIYGLTTSPARAWHNLLLNNFYFLAIALMAVVFVAINYLSSAGWAVVLRRVPEAMAGYLPLGATLMLLILFAGMPSTYHWAQDGVVQHDEILRQKAAYLSVPAFGLRMIIVLVLWLALSTLILRNSRAQDTDGGVGFTTRNVRLSAIFIIVFGVSFSLAAIDWLMSLEPHWYSTLYPWYVMASVFVSSLAFVTVLVILLRKRGFFPEINTHHLHDLGKFVFAFSIFWGYLWFSQYMIIWYSNIPEETPHFLLRSGNWQGLFLFNMVINLVVPFLLLPAGNKKNENILLTLSVIVVAGHWLDFYLLVMPSYMTEGPSIGILEIGIGLGVIAMFLLVCDRTLRRHALAPTNDPYYEESLHHHV